MAGAGAVHRALRSRGSVFACSRCPRAALPAPSQHEPARPPTPLRPIVVGADAFIAGTARASRAATTTGRNNTRAHATRAGHVPRSPDQRAAVAAGAGGSAL